MSSRCPREASDACFHGCSPFLSAPPASSSRTPAAVFRSDFAASVASSLQTNSAFTNHESLPSLQESFSNFAGAFPQFTETEQADAIRDREYPQLSSTGHVCLDYSIGHGLFSYSQQRIPGSVLPSSSSHPPAVSPRASFFEISCKPVNLGAQLAYGGPESELESSTRKRITRFMNLSGDDYAMVFASNQSAASRIIADAYPFRSHRNLLTVYDHQSEAVELMIKSSRRRGAKVKTAEFSWPSLRIQSAKLKNVLVGNVQISVRFNSSSTLVISSRWNSTITQCSSNQKSMRTNATFSCTVIFNR